jgi:hypothetical protein
VTVPLHRVRNYEELEGGQGREVFFRPHRYRAADLLPLRSEVLVRGSTGEKSCALLDVSENGAAFEWPKDLEVSVGDRLETVAVRFDARESYRGEARVGSVREMNGATIVGVSFERLLLSIDQVLEVRAVKAFAEQHAAPTAIWRVNGHDRFKSLVSELRLYLEDCDRQLRPLETELPWHVLHGEESPGRDELVRTLRAHIAVEVVRAMDEIDRTVRSVPEAHNAALGGFSRRNHHQFLLHAPPPRRAYLNPFR